VAALSRAAKPAHLSSSNPSWLGASDAPLGESLAHTGPAHQQQQRTGLGWLARALLALAVRSRERTTSTAPAEALTSVAADEHEEAEEEEQRARASWKYRSWGPRGMMCKVAASYIGVYETHKVSSRCVTDWLAGCASLRTVTSLGLHCTSLALIWTRLLLALSPCSGSVPHPPPPSLPLCPYGLPHSTTASPSW
jgi:hypothetical protein